MIESIQINDFFETEKDIYTNQYEEDFIHLLPITRNRLEEKFGNKLNEIEIDELMEKFEEQL
jgi:hypothetical protein